MSAVRWRIAGALAALAALGAVAAPAAEAQRAAGPIQVAGPPEVAADSDAIDVADRLYARTRGTQVCLALSPSNLPLPEEDGSVSGLGNECAEVEREDLYLPLHVRLQDSSGEGDHALAGAVRGEVVTVEVRLQDGRTLRLPTVPAPPALAGTAAEGLRFYLAEDPGTAVAGWRLLDAAGALVHEDDAPGTGFDGPVERGPLRVASGRDGRLRWSLFAAVHRPLDPVPGDPGHRGRRLCLSLARSDRDGGDRRDLVCLPADLARTELDPDAACETAASQYVVVGVAPPGQAPRGLVAGDGSRAPLRTVRLPAALGLPGLRAVVGTAPRGMAIRRVLGAPGTTLFAPPPGLLTCGTTIVLADDTAPQPPLGGDAVLRPAGPAGPRLHVRDRGDADLCLAAERPVRARDCWQPPPWLTALRVAVAGDGRMVVGAVDARVKQVRLTLTSGAELRVPTVPGDGYTGRYARALAFFAVTAPAGTRVLAAAAVAPGGSAVAPDVLTAPRLLRAPTVHGAVRIAGAPVRVISAPMEDGETCVSIAEGRLPAAGERCPQGGLDGQPPLLLADCDGPAVTVGGLVPGSGRTLVAVLAGGRTVRVPVVRTAKDAGVAFVTVPAGAELRRLEVRGRRGTLLRRYAAPAPAANDQCGYAAILSQADPRGPVLEG